MKTILVLLLILAMCAGVMYGCDAPLSPSSYTYDNAGQYTAGACTLEENVSHIEIDWLSGDVTVRYHDEDYIAVTETASRTLSKDASLHFWLDGDTLRIRYAKSGKLRAANLPAKNLTLCLPRNADLEKLAVETVSADVFVREISSKEFDLDTVSGNIEASGVYVADGFDADSVSGSITVHTLGNGGSLDAETTSGAIDITAETLNSISLCSASGTITAAANSVARNSDLETLSGRVELHLPEDAVFTVRASTLSGNFDSDFPYDKAEDVYICGSSGPEFDIETLSGNIFVLSDG